MLKRGTVTDDRDLQMGKGRAVDLRSLPEFEEQLDQFIEDKSVERMTLKSPKNG